MSYYIVFENFTINIGLYIQYSQYFNNNYPYN